MPAISDSNATIPRLASSGPSENAKTRASVNDVGSGVEDESELLIGALAPTAAAAARSRATSPRSVGSITRPFAANASFKKCCVVYFFVWGGEHGFCLVTSNNKRGGNMQCSR